MTSIDNAETAIVTAVSDPMYDEDNNYKIDGTKCTVTVSDGSANGKSCGKLGAKKRCEFHYLLSRDSAKRRDCRIGSGEGLVSPKRREKYTPLLQALIRAVQNDDTRSKTKESPK